MCIVIYNISSKNCIFSMTKKKENLSEDELDELLDQTFENQDMIHHKCQIRDDPAKKQAEWEKKYGK